jgi:hypothetical protein
MSEPARSPVELLLDVEDMLLEALLLVENLAGDASAEPLVPWSFVGRLSQLRAQTVESDWDYVFWEVRHWLAGSRNNGPYTVGDRVWSCAGQCLIDVVSRIEDAVWRYPPFGEALTAFDSVYYRYRLNLATDDTDPENVLPPEAAVLTETAPNEYMVQRPSEPIVLRSVWPGPGEPPTTLEAVVPDEVLEAARVLRAVWERGARLIEAIIRAQRDHIGAVALGRLRGEIEWECSRAVAEWDLRQPDRTRERLPRRFAAAEPVARDEQIAERDTWIYDQVMEGKLTYDAIMRKLRREAPARGWRILGSAEAIRQRAIRHAELHDLAMPKPRQNR